ncbi:MAG: nuclear transport factor 2 family protein [Cellvibrionales bacterium]|nr:nuclear transport factor 2 family protein [Cellvibrionales bacterium]
MPIPPPEPALLGQLKAFYRDLLHMPLDDIEQLYSQDIVFRDPLHQLRGTAELHAYLHRLCSGLRSGRFECLDQTSSAGNAFIKWNMHFCHPRLGSKTISVRGISHLHFAERIHYHEDIYDLGAMLYEQIPLLRAPTRWLKRRLTT